MKNIAPIIWIACLYLTFTACTDRVDVDLQEADALLIVDAWLDDRAQDQSLRLSWTQGYFEQSFTQGLNEATVKLTRDDGTVFNFDSAGDGQYVWTSNSGARLGEADDAFDLEIDYNGKTYTASSQFNRVPQIDSIRQEYVEGELGQDDGIYVELFSRDLEGDGDAYWIKSYKNGQFLNRPSEMNVAFDAGFSPGSNSDGLIFIPPIRSAINPFEDEDQAWSLGDICRVEIHSINLETYYFLREIFTQMTNGNSGIFSVPVSNVRGNISSSDPEEEVVGMFNMSMVSAYEQVIDLVE